MPAQEVLRIARTVILARVAQGKGDHRTAVARFERAAALQDVLPYTEPPLLVLSDQAVACRCFAAGRPPRRGGTTVPARAQPSAIQWMVVLRTGGTVQVTW